MKQLIVLLGVAGASLSAVFVRWSTAPSLVLVFYRMAITAALMTPAVALRCRKELAGLHRREVLLCVVSRMETVTLRRIVFSVDPRAFVISAKAHDTYGEGFKEHD